MKKFFNILPLLIIGVLFYLLDSENEFISDDLYYSLSHPDYKPIESLGSLISSQVYDYFHQNGRFLIHLIVQLFCGVIGPDIFHIINTLIFLLFLYELRIYALRHTQYAISYSTLVVALIIFVPAWNITYLGYISGAVNYLWAGCAYIWWINLYESTINKEYSILKYCLLAIVSLVIGSLQESFCIGIAGYLFLNALSRRLKLSRAHMIMTLAFLIGATACILAPANFSRLAASVGSLTGILKYVSSVTKLLVNSTTFILLCLIFILLFIRKGSKTFIVNIIKDNLLIITAAVLNAMFVAIIAYSGQHQLTCIESYSMLVMLCAVYSIPSQRLTKYFHYIDKITFVCFIVFALVLYPDRKSIADAYTQLCHAASESKDGTVVATRYFDEVTQKRGWIRANFIRAQEPFETYNRKYLSLYLSRGQNSKMIKTLLPLEKEDIVEECKNGSNGREDVIRLKGTNALVIKSSKDLTDSSIRLFINPTMFGKLRNLYISGTKYNVDEKRIEELDSFEYNGLYYYVIMNDLNYNIEKVDVF